jgi:hypothetical protein
MRQLFRAAFRHLPVATRAGIRRRGGGRGGLARSLSRPLPLGTRAGFAVGTALVVVVSLGTGLAFSQAASGAAAATSAAASPARSTSASANAPIPKPKSHPVKRACGPVAAGRAACMAVVRTDVKAHRGLYSAQAAPGGPAGYGPADLISAYSLPSSTASAGDTVGVVDAYDDPNAEADLATYRAQYNLPACTSATGCFTKVAQDGSTNYPGRDAQWSVEISLDLDMVSAICPYCHILLVEANDDTVPNLGAAVNEAVALGAKYVSNSYAAVEQPWEATFDSQYYDHPGVVITAAADDDGYGPAYPAASPDVTAVGGTTLVQDSSVARGWAETAWPDSGSGCSAYEPKPAWQHDTGCGKRSIADVSADADPNTGVALYDTMDASGWGVSGGTSVATPIIAAVYALAGAPAAGSYPASYPYGATSALNDVTSGSNGACGGSYLCTARPGYDGPTGLGTPSGVSAFDAGPHGIVSGTLTDASTGSPLTHAEVDIGTAARAFTDSAGQYAASVPPGTYQATAKAFGYTSGTAASVTVTGGATTKESFALRPEPSQTIGGAITDGSGHGWPLYASVSVAGTTELTYSSPATGKYSLSLPDNASYTLQISAVYPGYRQITRQVQVGASGQTLDLSVPVDGAACAAPGYQWQYNGTTQTFDASSTPAGWTVVNNNANVGWEFDDPNGAPNNTGGSGNFAVAGAEYHGNEDTELVSPVLDLSGDSSPVVKFSSDLVTTFGDSASVDVSIDGGQTWTTVWQYQNYPGIPGPDLETVPLPSAAGQSQVQVRFHYHSIFGYFWQLDNVFIGDQVCAPTPGGLVAGNILDGNTGAGVNGATVAQSAGQSAPVTTAPAPLGSAAGDGFYFLFAPTGSDTLTAAMLNYVKGSRQVTVTPDTTTVANLTLKAGQLSISAPSVSATQSLGTSTTRTVRFTDTGQAPVSVRLDQQPGTAATGASNGAAAEQAKTATGPAAASSGAPLNRVRGHFSPLFMSGRTSGQAATHGAAARSGFAPTTAQLTASTNAGAGNASQAAGTAWSSITAAPIPIMDNAVATDPDTGLVYTAGGLSNGLAVSSALYVYNPGTAQWSALPSMPQPREAAEAAFIDGKLYVIGGWNATGDPLNGVAIYDPNSQTWSSGATMPTGYAASGLAALNGKIYVVGGCDAGFCGYRDVQVYDPATDAWSTAANYPVPISWGACGALDGAVYCAGGLTNSASGADTNAAYSYSPATGQWSPVAGLPFDLWGMSYATANGDLLLSGGVTSGGLTVTNQGFAFDPAKGTWSALPNSVNTDYRAGGSCGFYRIGGSPYGTNYSTFAEQLPGYDSCSGTSVPWLSQSRDSFTLQPSQTVTVTVTLNATPPAVSQPGSYSAGLTVSQDTPYSVAPVAVSLAVTPPHGWGEIAGTVTGRGCQGGPAPLADATVEVYGSGDSHWLLKTASDGSYSLWLPARGPVTVIAALDGWQPQASSEVVTAGQVSTLGFSLAGDAPCT